MAMTPGRSVAAEMAEMRLGELGLTQDQLAERADLSEWTINRFLKGRHWPQVRNRVKISVALWDDPMRLDELAKGQVPTEDLAAENAALRKLLSEAGQGPSIYPSRNMAAVADEAERRRKGPSE